MGTLTMQGGAEHTDSWYEYSTRPRQQWPALERDLDTDVCVIGGGYTGLSTALHLRKQGINVVLLEANRIGWGASGRNGGHVGTGQRADQSDLEQWVGKEAARSLWQLGLDAVALVSHLCEEWNIDCELGQGNLHLAAKARDAVGLREEVEHLRQDYGYQNIEYLSAAEAGALTSARGVHGAILDTGARHLHPLKYALGLAAACDTLGATLHEHSTVTGIDHLDQVTRVRTAQGNVTARKVVLGCNGYLGKLEPGIAGNIMPINNYMIATEPLSETVCASINRDRVSLSDTLFVINYWKLSEDRRLLFGGGETYRSRFPNDIKAFVRPYMLKLYPELEDTAIEFGWGGTLGITMNRMPDVGLVRERIYYAQGFSGHGVPTATMAGKMIAGAIGGDAKDFNVLSSVPTRSFPGGTLLRWPGLVAGMLYYSTLDRIGR